MSRCARSRALASQPRIKIITHNITERQSFTALPFAFTTKTPIEMPQKHRLKCHKNTDLLCGLK
jgi:hypothetical protein